MAAQRQAWKWTAQRRQCLKLFLAGASRRAIAHQLGIDRGTVNRHMRRHEFQVEAHRRCLAHFNDLRRRRSKQTESLCDGVLRLSQAAMDRVEAGDVQAIEDVRAFLCEFRSLRQQERQDWQVFEAGDVFVDAPNKVNDFRTFLLKLAEGLVRMPQ